MHSEFVGHSTEIIRQSKIKGTLFDFRFFFQIFNNETEKQCSADQEARKVFKKIFHQEFHFGKYILNPFLKSFKLGL